MKHLIRRLIQSERGTAAVEATLVIPLAVAIMAGSLEFGQVLNDFGTASKSLRDAARFLARIPAASVCDWGLTSAKNLAVYGNAGGSGPALIPGWSTTNISLVLPDCSTAPTGTFTIRLHGDVPYTGSLLTYIGASSNSLTLAVDHEQPHTGE